MIAKDTKSAELLNGETCDCYSKVKINSDEKVLIGARKIFLVQNVNGQTIWYELNKTFLIYTATNLRW